MLKYKDEPEEVWKKRRDRNTLLERYSVPSRVNLAGIFFFRETLPAGPEDREKLAWAWAGAQLSYVGRLAYKDNGRAELAQEHRNPNQFLREQFALFATVLGAHRDVNLLARKLLYQLCYARPGTYAGPDLLLHCLASRQASQKVTLYS